MSKGVETEPKKEAKKVYISGPMTGLPNFNREAFAEAERWCLMNGLSPFNPGWMTFSEDSAFTYEEILQIDLAALSVCDTILLLPGYEKSNGAKVELEMALRLGLKVEYYSK